MSTTIPIAYQAFFLWIEPASTFTGALLAWYLPEKYLALSYPDSTTTPPGLLDGLFSTPPTVATPIAAHIALRQLGNLYLAFGLSEALVLRSTADLKVWRAFLLVLLIADFGHVLACLPLGWDIYYRVETWNAMDWGNLGFVYCGALMRACFLAGLGLQDTAPFATSSSKPRSSVKFELNSNANDGLDPEAVVPAVDQSTIVVDPETEKAAETPKKKRGRKKKVQA